MNDSENLLLGTAGLRSAVAKLTEEINRTAWDAPVALVGLLSRGDLIAKRIAGQLKNAGREPRLGYIDISLYRDDLGIGKNPTLRSSHLPFPIDGTRVILVDDVLYTGRTIRAALNAVMDYGRPSKVELAVLVDRGGREMPIQPNFVGYISPSPGAQVTVFLEESDGLDQVTLN